MAPPRPNKGQLVGGPARTTYKNRPRAVHITVYDIQGSPIAPELVKQIVNTIEVMVKVSQNRALAIDVRQD
jgi:hypothetical protein